MKYLYMSTVFLVITFIAAFLFYKYNTDNTQKASKAPLENTQDQKIIHEISLLSDKAVPDVLSIKLGELVQFNSKDGRDHNMAQGEGDEFEKSHSHNEQAIESGRFGPDEGYRLELKKVGVYHFHDHYNPAVYSTIIVTK